MENTAAKLTSLSAVLWLVGNNAVVKGITRNKDRDANVVYTVEVEGSYYATEKLWEAATAHKGFSLELHEVRNVEELGPVRRFTVTRHYRATR